MNFTPGIHHITAMASDPKRNFDFYTKILGMRFIKKTVNYDDPTTYHFYFADKTGTPGTVLTFFPHPGLPRGKAGRGQAVEIAFAVPKSSLAFWIDRFHQKGIDYQGPEDRFGDRLIRITDPDGLFIELVGVDDVPSDNVWITDEIGADVAIRGFHGITLWVEDYTKTAALLTKHLGFQEAGMENSRYRYTTGKSGFGQVVDLRHLPGWERGRNGAGTIHHVAWRVGDDDSEVAVRDALAAEGFNITPVIDRNYFHSVYFREPNGVIFELATDAPGFAIDESVDELGHNLMLPPRYEAQRAEIVKILPVLEDVTLEDAT
ncbi:MAG TPA: ring-cleaving dioxygenase [Alphaproteobacteria bacterium]